MFLLGIKIDNLTKKEVLEKIKTFLNIPGQYKIFTPNPEMLVDAQTDLYFKEVLNSGDLNICDGKGIEIFAGEKIERISGIDLMTDILKLAEQNNYSVFFLGSGDKQTLEHLKNNLIKIYPNLKIAGLNKGLEINKILIENKEKLSFNKQENDELIGEIVMTKPQIIFVAFGHKKQEKWINEFLRDLPSVKIAMGVGGSFDYLADKTKRAPVWMRKIGLEWFFRLLSEPKKRVLRIFKAVFIFPYLIFKNKK
ncbi:MAG: WecB/TagA/CpsF family glycosyltransferase [Patescibacteria group bacterium]